MAKYQLNNHTWLTPVHDGESDCYKCYFLQRPKPHVYRCNAELAEKFERDNNLSRCVKENVIYIMVEPNE